MAKKSVSKTVNNVTGTFKNIFNTQNILSSIIVILLVVYMSFVNVHNVPKLFNNVIVKLLLFGLIVYTFCQDKIVALILTATVILSISLAQTTKTRNVDIEAENENDNLVLPESVPVNDENTLSTNVYNQSSRIE